MFCATMRVLQQDLQVNILDSVFTDKQSPGCMVFWGKATDYHSLLVAVRGEIMDMAPCDPGTKYVGFKQSRDDNDDTDEKDLKHE